MLIFAHMAEKGKLSFEQLMKDLEGKVYQPIYILHGEEPYFIDVVADYIEENILSESEKEFNQSVLYGKDVDTATIVSYAKRFPMMAEYQVLIIREAQDIEKIEDLEEYSRNPVPTTILVLCHKHRKIDQRKALIKNALKNGVVFYSERLYESKIPQWIASFLQQRGYRITPKAGMLLTEYLGADLGKIANELEKLFINIPEGAEINDLIIEENIGISKDYNIFELQNALGNKDVYKANQICNYFAANPREHPIIKTIALLYVFFNKLLLYHALQDKSARNVASELGIHPFFARDYITAARNYPYEKIERVISFLSDYDLRSKGYGDVSTPQGELLRELVYKILH